MRENLTRSEWPGGTLTSSLSLKARRIRAALLASAAIVVLIFILLATGSGKKEGTSATAIRPTEASIPPHTPVLGDYGTLAEGSDPKVTSFSFLVADRANDRLIEMDPLGRITWEFPKPGDLGPGQTFKGPVDPSYTPDGRHVIVSHPDEGVVTEIDLVTNKISWGHGKPGKSGSGPGELSGPRGAVMTIGGQVVIADSKNCRVLIVNRDNSIATEFGKVGQCKHGEGTLGTPISAQPLANGRLLVTEATGAWVNEVTMEGTVLTPTRIPNVKNPGYSTQMKDGSFLTTSVAKPGKLVAFDKKAKTTWSFGEQKGPAVMAEPSFASELPSGLIAVTDTGNHRLFLLDRKSGKIVWQFGATGTAGRGPGQLNRPEGVAIVPPGI